MPGVRIQLVVGLTARHDGVDRYSWRLLGGNNREHARSAQSHLDREDALAALASLRSELGRSVPTVAIDRETRLWIWRVDIDDETRIRSPRGHLRRLDAEEGVRRCLAVLPLARVSPVLLDNRRSDLGRARAGAGPRGLAYGLHAPGVELPVTGSTPPSSATV